MKKNKLFAFIALLCLTLMAFVGCGKETSGTAKAIVAEQTETTLVIKVETVSGEVTLVEVMSGLKQAEVISYTISSGMVTEINGKANAADYSSCWMLYTSDSELANAQWGTYVYNGETLGSAIVGADTLTVTAGAYYVWYYQSF